MTCNECKVGPGAYEAEGPETAILEHYSLLGCADDIVDNEDQYHKDVFLGPIEVTEDAVEFATKAGYCTLCIEIATKDLAECKSATYWTDQIGFRFSEIHSC